MLEGEQKTYSKKGTGLQDNIHLETGDTDSRGVHGQHVAEPEYVNCNPVSTTHSPFPGNPPPASARHTVPPSAALCCCHGCLGLQLTGRTNLIPAVGSGCEAGGKVSVQDSVRGSEKMRANE